MFHVENVQFGESAWSLIISKWFLFSRSSICLSIASSIGIRLDGAVFTTNCISRMVSSKSIGNGQNRVSTQKWVTMTLLTSLCWWLMMVHIFRFWLQKSMFVIFLHVCDNPIGHQHHYTRMWGMPECDVDDWYFMLVPNSWCWWCDLSPTSQTCHQHTWSPTSVNNIDVTKISFFSLCWWFSQCIKSVTNILNGSPTTQTCHQHIWSPTSVTNIDATVEMILIKVKVTLRSEPTFKIERILIKTHE